MIILIDELILNFGYTNTNIYLPLIPIRIYITPIIISLSLLKKVSNSIIHDASLFTTTNQRRMLFHQSSN